MIPRKLYIATSGFEAARQVKILPPDHPSRRIHGHSFLAKVRTEIPAGYSDFPGGELLLLKSYLDRCINPLNYNDLNKHLSIPTDENLARWVQNRLQDLPIHSVGIQSTTHQGADLDQNNHVHIWHKFRFEAAHQLPNVPLGHQCGRLHGHGFEVILHANQDINSLEMGIDFDQLNEIWKPIYSELNYRYLNDIRGLENPTSENISRWIWDRLKSELPELSWVTVFESATAGCHYDGLQYRIWKDQRFESAVKLERSPKDGMFNQIHGHSYLLRLHLTSPLDKVMGWTVDYGDVKRIFSPVYQILDHNLLNNLPDVRDADIESIAEWIKRSVERELPQLDRIDLYETPGCGVQLCWTDSDPALPV